MSDYFAVMQDFDVRIHGLTISNFYVSFKKDFPRHWVPLPDRGVLFQL